MVFNNRFFVLYVLWNFYTMGRNKSLDLFDNDLGNQIIYCKYCGKKYFDNINKLTNHLFNKCFKYPAHQLAISDNDNRTDDDTVIVETSMSTSNTHIIEEKLYYFLFT